MTRMRAFALALPLTLTACGGAPGEGDPAGNTASTAGGALMPMNEEAALAENTALAPLPEPPANLAAEDAAMPGIDAPPNPDRSRPVASPSPEPGRDAAARLVRHYYARIAKRDFAAARAMWDDGGSASGLSPEAFAERFERFSEFGVEVGIPDHINAGAGQRYVEVPVRVSGRLKEGEEQFERRGIVTLHRTGDIEGATPAQRQWRIAGAEILPKTESGDAADPAQKAPATDAPAIVIARYDCANGARIIARFDNRAETAMLRRGYQKFGTLEQVRAASGIWYRGEGVELRGKGDQATITLPGEKPVQCEARAR
ncbi:MliC family protein [Sphingomonas sp.]|uniref:MliC family protein n=1 Tax=Sphingomonas sp. TaxID=28214 RepID=UPI002B50BEDD|nr:MliC family protein [Sphingomonas sp.]HTG37265.1 MliC family protein [Sphingomonas sp.]